MNHNLIVSESIAIKATPALVWEALTNPQIIKEYLFGTETITNWKIGSEIIFQGEYSGQKYRDKGVVQEFLPHERISYKYWSGFSGLEDKPENYALVLYTLLPIDDNHTKFTWTQTGYVDEARRRHSEDGMATLLSKIKEIVERKN